MTAAKSLDKHIEQAKYYLEFKPFIQRRKQMKPKQQESYTESHRREFTLYEAAERYLMGIINDKTSLPLKAWKAGSDKQNAYRLQLNGEYV